MAETGSQESVADLCYHCNVRKTKRICFADDTSCFYDAKAVDTAKAYWQMISEQVIKEKNRAQTLATIVSSKVLEIVKFFGNTFADMPIDLKACRDVQFDMFAMPESIRMCQHCQCFFSRQPSCHCETCMGENYRTHYVILMHGVLAEPFQMAAVAQYLLKANPQIFIYFPHNIAGKSLVGLELVLDMFASEILALFDKVPNKIKISLIGHSFGGIILRYWLLFYYRKTPGVYSKVKDNGSQHRCQRTYSDSNTEEEEEEEVVEEDEEEYYMDCNGNAEEEVYMDCNGNAEEGNHMEQGEKGAYHLHTHRYIDIEWANYISMATPHAGIYENHAAFRKLVSFMGSRSIDQLDNESVELLLLLCKDARQSIRLFQNVVVYGNLSGDTLVGPRTSILLPYHKVNSNILKYFIKAAEDVPGVPQHVCELLAKYEPADESEGSTPSSDGENQPTGREEKMEKLMHTFYKIAAKKIKNTPFNPRLTAVALQETEISDDQAVFRQVFTQEDVEYFTLLVSQIADRANGKLTKKLLTNPKFLYNEIMLAGLWDMTQHKFAVYLPIICIPHHSIVSVVELGTGQGYTQSVLSHVTYMFVP